MQVIQMIYHLSVAHPLHYWSGIIVLLLIVCAGGFKLGTMRLAFAGVASPGPARRPFSVAWRFKPFAHTLAVQIAGVMVVGRLESDVDYMAASFAVRLQ